MNADRVQAMLRIDRIGWDALVSLLDAHPGESLHDPASPRWTSRDVYAHFTRWLNHSNACIEAYCSGRKPPPLEADPGEMNTRWQQEDSQMSLDEAREKALSAFERRVEIIASIPPDKWDGELDRIVRYDGAAHYTMHLNYIVTALKESNGDLNGLYKTNQS
jgi:hypothetical protein